MTKEEALKVANEMRQWFKTDREKEALETLIPELKESEDERIRKEIIGYLNSKVATAEETELLYFKRWISYLENLKPSFKQIHDSVMWDSGLRTGIELGKKKEQEPISFNEPYNPNDYEVVMQGNATSIRRKQQEEQKPSISCGHENDAEWDQEDKEKIVTISEIIEHCTTIPYSGGTLTLNKEYKKELLCFIRTLRPSWKPSEEQLLQLRCAISGCSYDIEPLVSLEEQLKQL